MTVKTINEALSLWGYEIDPEKVNGFPVASHLCSRGTGVRDCSHAARMTMHDFLNADLTSSTGLSCHIFSSGSPIFSQMFYYKIDVAHLQDPEDFFDPEYYMEARSDNDTLLLPHASGLLFSEMYEEVIRREIRKQPSRAEKHLEDFAYAYGPDVRATPTGDFSYVRFDDHRDAPHRHLESLYGHVASNVFKVPTHLLQTAPLRRRQLQPAVYYWAHSQKFTNFKGDEPVTTFGHLEVIEVAPVLPQDTDATRETARGLYENLSLIEAFNAARLV